MFKLFKFLLTTADIKTSVENDLGWVWKEGDDVHK